MRGSCKHVKRAGSMAEKTEELALDRSQAKKAVQALQAFLKSKSTRDSLFLDETQQISLLFTLWKIPRQAQTIRIPLPHGQRPDTDEVCLFTRDEPNMTSDQTQRFYKKLLEERGVKSISEIIPYKVLRTEYKPYEAKRRLLGNFDLFLSDDRIRRLLPSHLGKHFYERKKEPLCVNLQSKQLARDIQRVIQGSSMKVTNKGCCCMARIGHSGMTADEVTDNIEAAVKTVVSKLRTKGPVIKLIHLKSQTSVALPIYTSDLSHLNVLEEAQEQAQAARKKVAAKKKVKKEQKEKTTEKTKKTDAPSEKKTEKKKKKKEKEEKAEAAEKEKEEAKEEEEDIPQLVPIETPSKKPKLEKPSKKKPLEKAPEPTAQKKGTKGQNKPTKKPGKTASQKLKRKVLKSK
ncbi:ribosomal L1 domain-containing protein 1 [Myripristis murdjan]|uniref:ribosomal L1 domain-containing protein 1 n=1 Tax=Myripristis murdjan TaxID=586833 RepID=UPI001175F92C|nr:ribosomal L1 domain-containing protein 1 [Myripristis murdjan]